jgi:hypothetical protein
VRTAGPRPRAADTEHALVPRATTLAFDVLGWMLVLMSARKLAYGVYAPLLPYDDGILLTGSMLVAGGEVPYRDFYTNYGPGIFLTIAALWKVVGTSALAARVLGCALQLAIAALSGLLAGRLTGRRFTALAAGLVAAWLSMLAPSPYAWFAALALALAAASCLCSAASAPSRGRWLAAGALLGMTGWYRPDFAVYFAVALLAIGTIARLALRQPGRRSWRDVLAWSPPALLGFLAASLPVWGPTIWLSGSQPLYDVLIDQLRIRPGRVLPGPPLLEWVNTEALVLPSFLARPDAGAFALACVGPLLAVLLAVAGKRLGVASPTAAAVVGALAAAVMPQMLGRSDLTHCLYAVAPALVLVAGCAQALVRLGAARCLAASCLVACAFLPARDLKPTLPGPPLFSTRAFPRYGGIPEQDAGLLAVARFLSENTSPDETIFVGLSDHRRTLLSHLLLYFVADRRGGTRYMQFDPNLTTREDVQRRMVADLEAHRTRWAVLFSGWAGWVEPNESIRPGSTTLDRHLSERYEPVARFGYFEVRRARKGR